MANTTSDRVSDITVAPTATVTGSRPLQAELIEDGEAEQGVRCQQRSDHDRRDCGVAEGEADSGAKQRGGGPWW